MILIQKLLSRVHWDADFSRGQFELGYFDRIEHRIIRVPFKEIEFPSADPGAFRIVDAAGRPQRVPFHRVREVYRDGQCIWRRG